MSIIRSRVLATLMVFFAVFPASAEGPNRPDPLDPAIASPPDYRSAFEGFQGFRAQGAGDWRGANDRVGAVGGHAGALRDGATAASPVPSRPAAPPGAVHHGH
jgi:hypothetical protein